MDSQMAEIAESLAMDDIPLKLRCAICNKLALNAFRTPCCDQSICENCQTSLPDACPICLHSPVKADDCRPVKALRMTIKAFLKKIMTEREKAQKKQTADTPSNTPVAVQADNTSERPASAAPHAKPVTEAHRPSDAASASLEASTGPSADISKPSEEGGHMPTEAQKDVPHQSIEATEDMVREESFQAQTQAEAAGEHQLASQANGFQQPQNQQNGQTQVGNPQWPAGQGVGQGITGGGFGFEGMNAGFPNMAINNPADFNSMMQFMPNNAMGGFPNMMGMPAMPGMGVDQMQAMSQGMFGGYSGPGMGMNGMNAGMGYPAAHGWNGGFNGQPGAWMSGQDKFNPNAYGGHANGMGGDFGGNAGYAGYNMPSHQGNFNQMNHHQFQNHDFQNGYHGQGFPNRGRGRGRGYAYAPRGRGGYNQVMHGNHTNHEAFHHQLPSQQSHQDNSYSQYPQQPYEAGKQSVDANVEENRPDDPKNAQATDEQIARSFAPGDADESPEAPATTTAEENAAAASENDEPEYTPAEAVPLAMDVEKPDEQDEQKAKDQPAEEQPAPIQTFVPDDPPQAEPDHPTSAVSTNSMMPPPNPAIIQPSQFTPVVEQPYEYSARGRGGARRFSRGASDFRMSGRGRGGPGYLPNGNTTNHVTQPAQALVTAPTEPKGVGVEGAPKGPKAMREGLPTSSLRGGRGFSIVGRASAAAQSRPNGPAPSRSRSTTRSRSRSRHRSHRHRHKHRSQSASTDSDREERRRERHKRRSRRHEDEDEDMEDQAGSVTHRSSHRNHGDRDDDRDDDKSRKSHRRSHRSHRDRSRDGESRSTRKRSRTPTEITETAPQSEATSSSRKRRERNEDEEARRERKRSRRDRHAEEEDHHTSSHRSKYHSSSNTSKVPPTAPSGPKSDRQKHSQPQTTHTEIDPHELERQARNRERLQKELQRREAME
ncbi:MAG: hypothetical protein Q9218_007745, partial [Villophora microphyllina]